MVRVTLSTCRLKVLCSCVELIRFPLPIEEFWKSSYVYSIIIKYLNEIIFQVAAECDHLLRSASVNSTEGTLEYVLQLMVSRYKEDFCHLQTEQCPLLDSVILNNQTAMTKVLAYSARIAQTMITSILQPQSMVNVSDILANIDGSSPTLLDAVSSPFMEILIEEFGEDISKPPHNRNSPALILNQRSIMALKLMDYVEEVLMYLSSMTGRKQSESSSKSPSYKEQVLFRFIYVFNLLCNGVMYFLGIINGRSYVLPP
jgi:hypothetical protein